jgi:hypothetical protein
MRTQGRSHKNNSRSARKVWGCERRAERREISSGRSYSSPRGVSRVAFPSSARIPLQANPWLTSARIPLQANPWLTSARIPLQANPWLTSALLRAPRSRRSCGAGGAGARVPARASRDADGRAMPRHHHHHHHHRRRHHLCRVPSVTSVNPRRCGLQNSCCRAKDGALEYLRLCQVSLGLLVS